MTCPNHWRPRVHSSDFTSNKCKLTSKTLGNTPFLCLWHHRSNTSLLYYYIAGASDPRHFGPSFNIIQVAHRHCTLYHGGRFLDLRLGSNLKNLFQVTLHLLIKLVRHIQGSITNNNLCNWAHIIRSSKSETPWVDNLKVSPKNTCHSAASGMLPVRTMRALS